MARPRMRALFVLAIVLSALAGASHARFLRLHSEQGQLLARPPSDGLPVMHAVNDVAPAVKNATALAIAKANNILTQYSNTLRIVSIPGGFIVTFLGSFLLTPVLFVAGFLSGGGVSFIATKAVIGAETPVAAWAAIAAMVVGGLSVAFITLRLMAVGMFAMGGMMGYMIAAALTPSVLTRIYPKDSNVGFYAGAIVLGLILGIVAIRFQRQMAIISTAYGGAFAFFFGIGYFAGHFPTEADLAKAEKGHFGKWFIVYSVLTLLFGCIGAFTQFRLAGRRPLVHSGRVEGARGGGFGWWATREDDSGLPGEEMVNLPQNERGKVGGEREFNSVIAAKDVFDSSSGELSRTDRFANSTSEGEVNIVGRSAVSQEKQREMAGSNRFSPEVVNNKNISGDTRISIG